MKVKVSYGFTEQVGHQMTAQPTPSSSNQASVDDGAVISLLATHTYSEVMTITGLSKGAIYRVALRSGARKTEARIQERHADRRRRQEEFLKSMINSTATADVLDFLEAIPDNSVQCHFTSPPYNVSKKYGECATADTMRFTYYHGWLMQCISEMARTVKPGGVVCVNVGKTPDWTGALMPMDVLLFEDMRRAGLTFQNRVIWTIPHGLTPSKRLADRHETLLIFSKGLAPTFYQGTRLAPGPRTCGMTYPRCDQITLTESLDATLLSFLSSWRSERSSFTRFPATWCATSFQDRAARLLRQSRLDDHLPVPTFSTAALGQTGSPPQLWTHSARFQASPTKARRYGRLRPGVWTRQQGRRPARSTRGCAKTSFLDPRACVAAYCRNPAFAQG